MKPLTDKRESPYQMGCGEILEFHRQDTGRSGGWAPQRARPGLLSLERCGGRLERCRGRRAPSRLLKPRPRPAEPRPRPCPAATAPAPQRNWPPRACGRRPSRAARECERGLAPACLLLSAAAGTRAPCQARAGAAGAGARLSSPAGRAAAGGTPPHLEAPMSRAVGTLPMAGASVLMILSRLQVSGLGCTPGAVTRAGLSWDQVPSSFKGHPTSAPPPKVPGRTCSQALPAPSSR